MAIYMYILRYLLSISGDTTNRFCIRELAKKPNRYELTTDSLHKLNPKKAPNKNLFNYMNLDNIEIRKFPLTFSVNLAFD